MQIQIKDIEKFIDDDNPDIYTWDKGDCSLIGIIKILLIQEIKKAKRDIYESRWTEMLSYLENNSDE